VGSISISSLTSTQTYSLPDASGTIALTSDIPSLTGYVQTTRTISTTSPLQGGGDLSANRTLSILQSGTSQDGYLSSTDWNTFNNKQAAGNYITALTGEASASGPGSASVTLSNSAVISKILTGLNVTGGSVVATDSILQAFGKVQNQINGLVGGSTYQGVWNASTNTPTLASGVGTQGYYYIVNVAGTTNLDGITDWNVGDWAIFDGTAWQQVDNTDAVVSVNGYTGAVNLVSSDIPEGLTNLYFTDSRARLALSSTATGLTYTNTTGVFSLTAGYSIPTTASQTNWDTAYTNRITSLTTTGTGAATLISNVLNIPTPPTATFTSLTTTGSSGSSTLSAGVLNVPTYTLAGLGGQPTLSGTGIVKSTAGTISYINGTTAEYVRGDGSLATFPTITGGTVTSVGLSMPSAFTVSIVLLLQVVQ
jgi:hypothetical protein